MDEEQAAVSTEDRSEPACKKTAKKRGKWIRRGILAVLGVIVLYLGAGMIIPSAWHKDVSEEVKAEFQAEELYAENEGTERVLSIDDNKDAVLWRIRAIESAQEEIIFSSFDFRDDDSGQVLMAALYGAAERGVHVRIIVDGYMTGLDMIGSSRFKALVCHPNVEAKFYNPVNLLTPWTFTFRMHDKYVIIDDRMYILGGRNSDDVSLSYTARTYNDDRDLLVYETDPGNPDTSLAQLAAYFTSIWDLSCTEEAAYTETDKVTEAGEELLAHYENLPAEYPEAYTDVPGEEEYVALTTATNRITLLSNTQEPAVREPVLWYELTQLMMDKEDVIIESPYVICSSAMYQGLSEVCESTTGVAIMTNAKENGNNICGNADYLNEKNNILKTGVTIYEYLGERYRHTKTVLIDDRISVVGSFNWDMRSVYLDTELMLVVDSVDFNAELRLMAQEHQDASRAVYPDGTTRDGPEIWAWEWPWYKAVGYTILRVLIIPFRYMA